MTAFPRIYLSPPDVSEADIKAVVAALRSGWVAPAGADLARFEQAVAEWTGATDAVALGSGTAGLHLALKAAGVSAGDKVIVPTLTFAATAFAVEYVGAEPVFVDVDPRNWQMCPELLQEAVGRCGNRLAAIIAVDLYGECGDMERIAAIAAARGIPLIEDAAEAMGAFRRHSAGDWISAGRWGRLGVFSFNGNKILTTSGGGMVIGDDRAMLERIRYWATQSRDPCPHYEHREIGYNYRLSNILASLGVSQMASLRHHLARRREIHRRYRSGLSGIAGLEWMPVDDDSRGNFWLNCVLLPEDREYPVESLRQYLEAVNIESRPLWKPMHLQPVFAGRETILNGEAEHLFRRGLCLPSGSGLDPTAQERIMERIQEFYQC